MYTAKQEEEYRAKKQEEKINEILAIVVREREASAEATKKAIWKTMSVSADSPLSQRYGTLDVGIINIFTKGFGKYFNGRCANKADIEEKAVILWCLKTCLEVFNPAVSARPGHLPRLRQKIVSARRAHPKDKFPKDDKVVRFMRKRSTYVRKR